jgi:hypothetical protein
VKTDTVPLTTGADRPRRDIHDGNVLVTRQVYELEEEAEWAAVLADLGEGKRLTGPN